MRLVDTHCHLDEQEHMGPKLAEVLRRAEEAGVVALVVPAYDRASWDRIRELSARHRIVHPAYGLHPWCAADLGPLAELPAFLGEAGAVTAIGEIGLDLAPEGGPLENQVRALNAQIELAIARDLPVLLHCRRAFPELAAELERYRGRLRGVVHAFSRSPATMRSFLELGLHVAFGGAVTRPGADRALRSAKACPPDRMLLETDAPYIGTNELAPEEVEPAAVLDVARSMASSLVLPVETIAETAAGDAREPFRLGLG